MSNATSSLTGATGADVDRRINASAVKASVNIVDVVRKYVPDLKRVGREYVGLSPFKIEKTPSFTVDPGKRAFFCFGTQEGGDVFDFIRLMENLTFHQAVMHLARDGDVPMDPDTQQRRLDAARARSDQQKREDAEKKQQRIAKAHEIARAVRDGAGTLVEAYLRARGVDCDALARMYGAPVPDGLKFHPDLRYYYRDKTSHIEFSGPAMVGLVRHPVTGALTGVHRTYLQADGSGKTDQTPKPKLTLGEVWGSVGALYPRRSLDHNVVMGEGYETTLTVMGALASRGEVVRGVSAITLGNMVGAGVTQAGVKRGEGRRRESPVPNPERPGLELAAPRVGDRKPALIMLRDNDGKDARAMDAMLARGQTKFENLGWRVRVAVPPVGMDFNDLAHGAPCATGRITDAVDATEDEGAG